MNAEIPDTSPTLFAELCLLGSIILDNSALDVVADLRSDQFRSSYYGTAYRASRGLHDSGIPIDAVTLYEQLEKTGEDYPWSELVESAMNSVPHAANARYYAEIIREDWQRRELRVLAAGLLQDSMEPGLEVSTLINRLEVTSARVTEEAATNRAAEMRHCLVEVINEMEREPTTGVTSGFPGLDALTLGFGPGNLIVVAARPGVGKTAFATGLALEAAKGDGSALYVSLEMTRVELAQRILSSHSGVSLHAIRGHKVFDAEWKRLMDAANDLSPRGLWIDDKAPYAVHEIAATARTLRRKTALKMVIVDYLQLIEQIDRRVTREQHIAQTTRYLKILSQQLGIPVILLAQLNRNIEQRENKRPRLSDLRESGAIEQDASVVIFLDRPHLWDPSAEPQQAQLIVAKNRHGATGDVPLLWDGPSATFSNVPDGHDGYGELF